MARCPLMLQRHYTFISIHAFSGIPTQTLRHSITNHYTGWVANNHLKMQLQSKAGPRIFTTTPHPMFCILRESRDSAKKSSMESKGASTSSEGKPTLIQEK
ncbi:hypothetical protein TNCV_164701 [Trichonephila clavipes]|nr:hypothetical protein TNCV_164701 [Trichonephila clavipes]